MCCFTLYCGLTLLLFLFVFIFLWGKHGEFINRSSLDPNVIYYYGRLIGLDRALSKIFLEKVVVPQLVKEFRIFHTA